MEAQLGIWSEISKSQQNSSQRQLSPISEGFHSYNDSECSVKIKNPPQQKQYLCPLFQYIFPFLTNAKGNHIQWCQKVSLTELKKNEHMNIIALNNKTSKLVASENKCCRRNIFNFKYFLEFKTRQTSFNSMVCLKKCVCADFLFCLTFFYLIQ